MPLDPTDIPGTQGLDPDDFTGELSEEELPTAELSDDDDEPLEPGIPDKLYFRIGEIAQLVGVDAHVLRYWESEFKMKPQRSASGQRLYRKQDLSRFLRIKHLLHDEGYTIAGARKILSGQLVPPAPSAPADAAKMREILGRIEGLRKQIRAIRDETDPRRRG